MRALKGGINAWYGHQKATVLLVTTPLPSAYAYENLQPYEGRGWCAAEKLMSAIVKDQDALLDLSKLRGDETSVQQIIANGKAARPAPMAPDAFREMLRSGVENGEIKFTNKGDVELVADIYSRAFIDEMSAATKLYYGDLSWTDVHVSTLSSALTAASGSLAQLTVSSHPAEPSPAHQALVCALS